MLNFGAKYPIGIDIGNQNIYAAQLKQTRKGFAVRELVHREYTAEETAEPGAEHALVSAVKDVSKNRRFNGKTAILHIPEKNISVFPIRFNVDRTETLEEAIFRESEKHLSFPPEDAVIDYPSLTPVSSGSETTYKATIIAARRDHIEQYLNQMNKVGLVVEAVDFPVSSLIRLHTHLHGVIQSPTILCNIGHTQTLFSAVSQESILAQRNISWGIQFLFDKIMTNLELLDGKENTKRLLQTMPIRLTQVMVAFDSVLRIADRVEALTCRDF